MDSSENSNVPDSNEEQKLPKGFESDKRKMWLYERCLALIASRRVIIIYGSYYIFNGWFYEKDIDLNSNYIITELLRDGLTYPLPGDIKFVKSILMTNAYKINDNEIVNNPDYALFRNTVLNLNTLECLPIGHNYFATGAINACYERNLLSRPLLLDNLLNDISGGNLGIFERLWEVIAYALSPEYRHRFIFCFIGVGGSGKSLLLNLIEKLLTPTLNVNMSIQNLTGSRFALSELAGKRVCIASDEGNFNFSTASAAILKRISGGGETITADVKGKNQVTFVCTAKLLIASNNPIHIAARQTDSYLHKRMIVVPFLNTVPVEHQDINLIDKLLAERDAIVTRAAHIFFTLKKRGFLFSGNENELQALADTATRRYSVDPLVIFSEQYCTFTENSFTATSDLFSRFTEIFPYNCYKDETAFSRDFFTLNQHRMSRHRLHTSDANIRGFKGVKLIDVPASS